MAKTSIDVNHVARVEGHGDIHVVIEDGYVKKCQMSVTEPARLFESMVLGRVFSDIPYVSSRICGICSASHVVTDILAVEDAFDIKVSERTKALRELLIYGSYLQNHAAHLFVFAAPDFLGMKSVFPLAELDYNLYQKAIGIKALGNELCNTIGGRSIHPITAVVGGFTQEISSGEYLRLADKLDAAYEFCVEVVDLFNDFDVVDIRTSGDMLAMKSTKQYAVCTEREALFALSNESFPIENLDDAIEEYVADHSAALFSRKRSSSSSFFTGALARINASWDYLSYEAKVAAAKVGLRPPEKNPFKNNVAQAVELVDVTKRCALLCRQLAEKGSDWGGSTKPVPYTVKESNGIGFTEAPRGSLFHRLSFDENGRVTKANIITPTAQNVANLEADMKLLAQKLVLDGASKDQITFEIEKLVRAYDPCFSCSVH